MTARHISETIGWTMDSIDHASAGSPLSEPTGRRDLDHILSGGIAPGQLAVISGRTGHGKSTLALDMIRSTAIADNGMVLFASAEQGVDEVTMRILAAEAGVPIAAIRTGRLIEDQWSKLTDSIARVTDAKIIINDSVLTALDVIRDALEYGAEGGLSLIVVDGLNLLTSGEATNSRYEDVAMMSRALKNLAKDLNVPVVITAGLSRGIEERGDDARPRLSDLRDSGTLEEDADIVIFVHRPDAENRDHERAGEVDFIVAKNRTGVTGTVRAAHQLHYSRFMDLAPRE